MNLLNKSFLKVKKIKLDIGEVYLKELNGAQLMEFKTRCIDEKGELFNLTEFEKMAYLLCMVNCDENGNLLQSTNDYKLVVENLPHNVLDYLTKEIYNTNDVTGENAKN